MYVYQRFIFTTLFKRTGGNLSPNLAMTYGGCLVRINRGEGVTSQVGSPLTVTLVTQTT